VCESSNYRGITLSSIIGKIINLVLLDRLSTELVTSELQFGFKKGCSTNMWTMVLKETVAYYTSNQSPVFCVMLDATKAFDRVSYVRLFRMLQDRNIPPVVLRFLLNSYLNQSTQVIWDTCKSEYLPVIKRCETGWYM